MLARGEPIVGIGSADAHGLRRFGLYLGPYAAIFKMVRTHLLVRELSADEIYKALSQGHAFVAHDIIADARRFTFLAVFQNSVKGIMGDQIKYQPGLRFYAYLPSPGQIVLMRDGRILETANGQHAWFETPGPGIYRVEVTRKGKPWIYSNPIYVVK